MRIHIENDPNGSAALRLPPETLHSHLERAGLLDSSLLISANEDPDRMADAVAGAEILFACRKISIAKAKQASPNLAWVQVLSAGVDALMPDLPADVVLTNASGVHAEKGGEYALTAALMLNYGIPGFASDKTERRWKPHFGGPVAGRRVLLLGVGGIGRAAAPLLRQHGMIVTGLTRSARSDIALDHCVGPESLDAALTETDILISTLPLTAETRGLIDRRRLQLLPKGAGVVVLGRADVFDYDAMGELLASGQLGGAVLDVFPKEPLPVEHPLWGAPRLIMTPHCSVDDHDVYMERCLEIFVDNFRRFRNGSTLINIVDHTLGY